MKKPIRSKRCLYRVWIWMNLMKVVKTISKSHNLSEPATFTILKWRYIHYHKGYYKTHQSYVIKINIELEALNKQELQQGCQSRRIQWSCTLRENQNCTQEGWLQRLVKMVVIRIDKDLILAIILLYKSNYNLSLMGQLTSLISLRAMPKARAILLLVIYLKGPRVYLTIDLEYWKKIDQMKIYWRKWKL